VLTATLIILGFILLGIIFTLVVLGGRLTNLATMKGTLSRIPGLEADSEAIEKDSPL